MIVPNKFVKLEETPLGKIALIMAEGASGNEVSIYDLYERVSQKFDSIEEFTYALDILFLVDKITWIPERSAIVYAD